MSTEPTRYLAAVDGQNGMAHVVGVAADLSSAMGGHAELHLVHVIEPRVPEIPYGLVSVEGVFEEGRKVLDEALSLASARFAGSIVAHLVSGKAASEIVDLAAEIGADLLVVGTADKGVVDRVLIGSVASKVARDARCPVLVAREKTHAKTISIEPPCPDCLKVQQDTKRVQLWCTRHQTHHPKGHVHRELPQSFALGSMLVRPDSLG